MHVDRRDDHLPQLVDRLAQLELVSDLDLALHVVRAPEPRERQHHRRGRQSAERQRRARRCLPHVLLRRRHEAQGEATVGATAWNSSEKSTRS
ncbi:MAG: hypothetical protein U0228_05795 [Myxococcaceae bacterium]